MRNPNLSYVTNTDGRRRTRNELLYDGLWPVLTGVLPSSIITQWGIRNTIGPGLFDPLSLSHEENGYYLVADMSDSCRWIPVWVYILAHAHFPEKPLRVFTPACTEDLRMMKSDYEKMLEHPKGIMLLLTEYQMKDKRLRGLSHEAHNYLVVAMTCTNELISRKLKVG